MVLYCNCCSTHESRFGVLQYYRYGIISCSYTSFYHVLSAYRKTDIFGIFGYLKLAVHRQDPPLHAGQRWGHSQRNQRKDSTQPGNGDDNDSMTIFQGWNIFSKKNNGNSWNLDLRPPQGRLFRGSGGLRGDSACNGRGLGWIHDTLRAAVPSLILGCFFLVGLNFYNYRYSKNFTGRWIWILVWCLKFLDSFMIHLSVGLFPVTHRGFSAHIGDGSRWCQRPWCEQHPWGLH